jgi:hypothetical protein
MALDVLMIVIITFMKQAILKHILNNNRPDLQELQRNMHS